MENEKQIRNFNEHFFWRNKKNIYEKLDKQRERFSNRTLGTRSRNLGQKNG